ncbi:sulfate adenylyltransferase subunit 1 [Lacrimispora sp. 38-1]|uniref:sulfate adenylyltransferase subunit 1 n=1 Tax=Lacrimispora sp. 38-1 TaxID=3125778 RepID=UPI003CF1AEC1
MNGLLKFITCGSVDDGKSTLIGHILYDSKLLYADQEKALLLDSKVGSRGGEIDYSLLLDGLMAEREQGITIDVAYRYFTTERRSFIVADTPGHEEYTRNMAVGASFAQLAVILVDAKQGVLVQTRRHLRICSLMGIHHFIFAVNKMDLADYSQERFEEISRSIAALTEELSLTHVTIIPVSATEGDNVTVKSDHMPWYEGETLLSSLEETEVAREEGSGFYMPVQRVCRPDHEFRGFQGQVESGTVSVGQSLTILPGNETAKVKSILVGDRSSDQAAAGQAVTIQLDREVDVSRGSVLTDQDQLPVSKEVKASILWMDEAPLKEGNDYLLKLGTRMLPAVVKRIDYRVDINTGEHLSAREIGKNEIASCLLEFSQRIPVDEFKRNKTLGELILIDRVSHMTSACGVVEHVESGEEKPYFEKGGLRAGGYIFEEFYFNLENAFLSRQKTKEITYRQGDFVPVSGDSFHYPDFFDVISLEDSVAVLVRNRTILDIISLDDYGYSGLPILDERGFALKIGSKEDLLNCLEEYKNMAGNKIAFQNKWSKFETYRRIVCNENFWII